MHEQLCAHAHVHTERKITGNEVREKEKVGSEQEMRKEGGMEREGEEEGRRGGRGRKKRGRRGERQRKPGENTTGEQPGKTVAYVFLHTSLSFRLLPVLLLSVLHLPEGFLNILLVQTFHFTLVEVAYLPQHLRGNLGGLAGQGRNLMAYVYTRREGGIDDVLV